MASLVIMTENAPDDAGWSVRGKNKIAGNGGAGGIRTLDRALQPYNGLANRRLQPLGHSSAVADMPDTRASRKQQISDGPISSCLFSSWRRVLPSGP
jgi:hypothetical protein